MKMGLLAFECENSNIAPDSIAPSSHINDRIVDWVSDKMSRQPCEILWVVSSTREH